MNNSVIKTYKIFCFALWLIGGTVLATTGYSAPPHAKPHPGIDYVPDAKTAVSIAKAVGTAFEGKESVDSKTFKAHLKKDVWTVYGIPPKDSFGDQIEVEISKNTGEILSEGIADILHHVPASKRHAQH